MAKTSSLWPRPSALIFLALLQVALSLHSPSPSPSPSPGPASDDSTQISSPPSPPPSRPTSPSSAPSESPTPSPSPSSSSADLSHTGVLDHNTGRGGKSEGASGGRKAGIALAVIVCAVLVVIGGMVYKKRRDNIRRQQYSYSGRGEIQL